MNGPDHSTPRSSFRSRRAKRARRASKRAGFTLIELIVSMVIMGIAVTALISLHNTSFQTHMLNQDLMVSNSLADQLIELIQIDSLRWTNSAGLTRTYFLNNGANHRMTILNSDGSYQALRWNAYTMKPVDYKLRDVDDKSAAGNIQGRQRRFCVFYKYHWAGANATNAVRALMANNMLQLDVAVMWPKKLDNLPTNDGGLNVRTFYNQCGTNGSGVTDYGETSKFLELSGNQDAVKRNFYQIRRTTYVRVGVE